MSKWLAALAGTIEAAGVVVFAFALILAVFCFMAWLLTIAWAHAVPAMLPGLVSAGHVAGSLTFHNACWVLLFIMYLRPSGFSRSKKEKE